MHKSFQLTPGPESRRRIRTRPVLAHLSCVGCGVLGFVATQLYLVGETDDLGIFPTDKRYLGAALCLVASVNAYWIMYQLAKLCVGISGLVSKSDVATLSPGITTYPDEWYCCRSSGDYSTGRESSKA